MKNFGIISLILSLIIIFSLSPAAYATAESAESGAAVTSGTHSLDAAVSYLGTDAHVENASAVFLYETGSQTLMYAQDPDKQVYPSSLVKIMTALVAVERGELSEMVTVDEQILAEVPYDAVSAELKPGEQISLNDLLYCMMVGSANDAAAVIAKHISGSQADFVAQMNAYAAELGCTGTNFVNPHGLHDEQQYSTVRDLAKILSAAVENEQFMTYFGTVHYSVPATNMSEARNFSTKNFLMNSDDMEIYYDARVTGGRTGISDDGTRCLAAIAQSDDLQLLCVLVGATSTFSENGDTVVYGSFKETSALFDSVFGKYRSVQVLYEGQALRQYGVVNGENDVVAGSAVTVSTILPASVTVADLDYRYNDVYQQIEAPLAAGDKLSAVEVWYGNMCVAQVDLLAMNAVAFTDPTANISETGDGGVTVLKIVLSIILIIAAVVFSVYIVLLTIRRINIKAAKYRVNRYRRNRRRSR